MVYQNYQNLIEMTSNIIDIVAFGVGFKCPRKTHLNAQCPPSPPLPASLHGKELCKYYKIVQVMTHIFWQNPDR